MNLGRAIEMAYVCGLETIDEAIYNVTYHATQLFYWPHIYLEEMELFEDYAEHGPGSVIDFLGPERCKEIDDEVEAACIGGPNPT